MSITIADYVLVPPAVVTIELKGAALDYFRQDRSRAVYKNKATLPGYIVAAAEDPNTRGKHFKVFLPEGVHFGWCDRQADDTIALFNKTFQVLGSSRTAPAPLPRVTGTDYEVYGGKTCRVCGQTHEPTYTITETGLTRFKSYSSQLS